jgi:hypothetical protein
MLIAPATQTAIVRSSPSPLSVKMLRYSVTGGGSLEIPETNMLMYAAPNGAFAPTMIP